MQSQKSIQHARNQRIQPVIKFRRLITTGLCGLALLLPLASLGNASEPDVTVKGKYALTAPNLKTSFSVNVIGGSQVTGVFKSVNGQMTLDSKHPEHSTVQVTVDLASVDTDNALITNFLKGPSMFDVENYKTAKFISTRVRKVDDRTAEVDGVLDMRGKRQRTTLIVELTGKDAKGKLNFTVTGGFYRGHFGMSIGEPVYSDRVSLNISGIGAPR